MIWLLATRLAFALPAAFLAPDGPAWLGPLPPPEAGAPCGVEGARCGSGPVAIVDPETGALWLEERDPVARGLAWEGTGWHLGGEPLADGASGPEGLLLTWSTDAAGHTHLDQIEGEDGVRRRYFYDANNRLSGALWADGTSLAVRYDPEGRVVATDGPGRARWRLDWRADLSVTDTLGNALSFHWKVDPVDGSRALSVADALGRTTLTWYGSEATGRAVQGWEDPRGLRTTVRGGEDGIRIEDGAGRVWGVLRDQSGRITEVTLPDGGAWRWRRDATGGVTEIVDPAGRHTRWERAASGAVVAVVSAGQPTLYPRDASGRVVSIQDPAGYSTQIRRDASGRVISLVDAGGDEITLARGRGPWPTGVVERTGARWRFDLDGLGRPGRVVDPTGRNLTLERDSSGHLGRLIDSLAGTLRLGFTAGGRLSRVQDGAGAITGLLRDAVGRLSGVRWSSGRTLLLGRDQGGDVVDLNVGGEGVHVRRDPTGLPLSAGSVFWDRDGGGNVRALRAPGMALRLARDGSGRLRGVEADLWALAITRDGAGRPVRWISTDGERSVTRDAAGRVVGEAGPNQITYQRDPRGWISAATTGGLTWHWSRDATGRILKASGPREISLGVDWDAAGRPVLLRYPGGDLAHRSWEDATLRERLEDASGHVLLERSTRLDSAGRPRREAQPCVGSWEAQPGDADGEIWRWVTPEGCDAQVPVAAWGVGTDTVRMARDGLGRIAAVSGEGGERSLAYDALGRLSALLGSDGSGWHFQYDPRGFLSSVVLPSGHEIPLLWASASGIWPRGDGDTWQEGPAAPPVLLANGAKAERVWVVGPEGLAGAAEADWTGAILALAQGSPRVVLLDTRDPQEIHTSSGGFPDSAAGGLAGADGAFQPFAGGPLFAAADLDAWTGAGSLARDPVSGRLVDGTQPWPWAERASPSPLDPAVWDPESPWSAPLRILTALGGLRPIDEGAWTEPAEEPPALSWLPASLDRARPPLGPAPDAMPFAEDPITTVFLRAALPGGDPPDAAAPARALLRSELALPWLPPGLEIPGIR